MDDANYMRLSCSAFSCKRERKAKGLCQMHYMQIRRDGKLTSPDKSCKHCGNRFIASQSNVIYCSKSCKHIAFLSANPDRAKKYRDNERVTPSALRKKAISSLRSAIAKVATRKKAEDKRLQDAKDRMDSNASVKCAVCGNHCGYVFGRLRVFCSMKCRKSTDAFKESRRVSKATRKARMRGVYAESFSAKYVFDRDGWKCQICGVSTPQSRRGTNHANAPELDHIKPLSKGGSHTKANTQCACRKCNNLKSDRLVLGQIGLFC